VKCPSWIRPTLEHAQASALLLAVLTLVLHWFLANRQVLGGTPLPPLGRFLSPQEGFWRNAEDVDEKHVQELKSDGPFRSGGGGLG
jgi:hypothetical protein